MLKIFLAFICLTLPAYAQIPAFKEALESWALKHKVKDATLIVQKQGIVLHSSSIGSFYPTNRYLIASLSKAITGACVASLVQNGKLTFETEISKSLEKFIAKNNLSLPPLALKVTIAQLLMHRSGAAGNRAAESSLSLKYIRKYSARVDIPKEALIDNLNFPDLGVSTAYNYSNSGYSLLEAIIQEASGQSYEETCKNAVLNPSARLHPEWRIMGAAGGWQMTGMDYLQFLDRLAFDDFKYGKTARDFTYSPDAKRLDNPQIWYSLGLNVRAAKNSGYNIWHWGNWVFLYNQGRININAFAARTYEGTSWFVALSPSVEPHAQLELDRALWQASKL